MPDPLRDQLSELLLKKDYIGETAQKLKTPPITPDRLQLIQDFITGDLVGLPPLTDSERRFFYEHRNWFPLLQILFEHEKLNQEVFARSIYRHYEHIMWRLRDLPELPHENVSDDFRVYIHELFDSFIWNISHELSLTNCSILKYIKQFHGSRYFLLAAQHVVNYQITKLKSPPDFIAGDGNPSDIIGRMAETTASDIHTDQDRKVIIEQIKRLGSNKTLFGDNEPSHTLQILMPVAKHYRTLLCDAFDWKDAVPLISFIEKTASQRYEYFRGNQYGDVTNSPDSESGVIDVVAARHVIEMAGDNLAREILTLFEGSKTFGANVAFLMQAVIGANRSVVEKKFRHHTQIAIKAYGLLPLEDKETVLDRYLALRQSVKDGQKFGQMRRATHAGAVQAALENLAQVAGYADASRLEWAMEAQIADEVAPPGRKWSVDNYTLELQVEGVDVSIDIYKDDCLLKSVPKAVRASDNYKEARVAIDQLRSQISRLRLELLEGLISTGDPLSSSDFEALLRLPVARDLC